MKKDSIKVKLAKERFPTQFFIKEIARGSMQETQLFMESYLKEMTSPVIMRQFILAFINQSYEINEHIPNASGFFYRIFQTPLTRPALTPGEVPSRYRNENELLQNRVFKINGRNIPLGSALYLNLLETAALYPKKKHYKRIIAYIKETEKPSSIDPVVIDKLTDVGIMAGYPVLVGSMLVEMVEMHFHVEKETTDKYVAYLDRIGYKNEAEMFREKFKNVSNESKFADSSQEEEQESGRESSDFEFEIPHRHFSDEFSSEAVKREQNWKDLDFKEFKGLKEKRHDPFFDQLDMLHFKNIVRQLSDYELSELSNAEQYDMTFEPLHGKPLSPPDPAQYERWRDVELTASELSSCTEVDEAGVLSD